MSTFSLVRPAASEIERFVAAQRELPLSYSEVGATENPTALAAVADRYTVDRDGVCLSSGRAGFERACEALRRWEMFNLGFVELLWPHAPIARKTDVGVLARAMGLWVLNAARIVYLVDRDEGGVREFGFAYGTLPGHVARGEERFVVQWRADDDSVWYQRLAISRPRHPLARLGQPYMRLIQRRFGAASNRAMLAACADATGGVATR